MNADDSSGGSRLWRLGLTALGVVYGDIGTSPLYAVHACFFSTSPQLSATPGHVLGVLSLIFWALIGVISVKYLLVVMRADNHGEGGILALLALLNPWSGPRQKRTAHILILLGIFGAALLLGDGMITPAVSVLSAVEGVEVAAPTMANFVVPLTVVILAGLFWIQKRGTQRIGSVFGPIMVVWFVVIGALGLSAILKSPQVLLAINPLEAVRLLLSEPTHAFLVLGGVFLVVTGGEALYADMGHFGAGPIRLAWFSLVLPCLLLNYFGQGAFILAHPASLQHPFYNLVPHWGVYPMIVLSTVVTVIASQAVISGTFSLARQAIQLRHLPPLTVIQTSSEEFGQIYVPLANLVLMIGTLGLVVAFGSSGALASAYGVAVSATMVITTGLLYFVMRERWHWPAWKASVVCTVFYTADLIFFSSNAVKIISGGWFPLTVAGSALLLMTTWARGRRLYQDRVASHAIEISVLIDSLALNPPTRVPGSAVFLTVPGNNAPGGLLHHLKLNQVLHELVILATVITEEVPRVPAAERLSVEPLHAGFYRIYVHYGFMQNPNIPVALKLCASQHLIPELDLDATAYYADRASLLLVDAKAGMPRWRKRLYAFMVRNSQRAVEQYNLPTGRSVELGLQVEL